MKKRFTNAQCPKCNYITKGETSNSDYVPTCPQCQAQMQVTGYEFVESFFDDDAETGG